jgi:hypothetical protein
MLKKNIIVYLATLIILSFNVFGAVGDNLQYYWSLDETSGVMMNSVNGSYGNLTVSGATRGYTGKISNAVSFDGVNDRLQSLVTKQMAPSDVTFSFWTNSSVLAGDKAYIQFYNSTAQYSNIVSIAQSGSKFSVLGMSATSDDGLLKAFIQNSQWTFVTITYNLTNKSMMVFINGTHINSSDGKGSWSWNSSEINVGLRHDNNIDYVGQLDEIAIWNRSLTTSEISSLYTDYQEGKNYTQIFISSPSTNTCSYTSGNWTIKIQDNCNITTAVTMTANSVLTINGSTSSSDRLYITGSIKGWAQTVWNGINTTIWGVLG